MQDSSVCVPWMAIVTSHVHIVSLSNAINRVYATLLMLAIDPMYGVFPETWKALRDARRSKKWGKYVDEQKFPTIWQNCRLTTRDEKYIVIIVLKVESARSLQRFNRINIERFALDLFSSRSRFYDNSYFNQQVVTLNIFQSGWNNEKITRERSVCINYFPQFLCLESLQRFPRIDRNTLYSNPDL